MNSGDRTKMRRHQAQATQAWREAGIAAGDVARQQLVERASKYQWAAADLKKGKKDTKLPYWA